VTSGAAVVVGFVVVVSSARALAAALIATSAFAALSASLTLPLLSLLVILRIVGASPLAFPRWDV
jgi:hypothetical protein